MSDGEAVQLYVYDLSRGLAKVFSPMLLDKTIEGVWHTSIVVGGTEYFYGHGINSATPGTTPCGTPVEVIELGRTHLDSGTRDALLADLSERYTPAAYSLFDNNCNNFSDDFARLLVGEGIPAHITALPEEVLATPFGQMLRPALTGLERQLGSMGQQPAAGTQAGAGGGTAPAAAPAPGRAAAQLLAQQLAAALTGTSGGTCAGDGPTSPRTLERDVDAAIARTMVADLRRQEAAGERSGRAGVEAEVEAELGSILAGGAGEEEAAALALQHEAQRLAGQQPLHGAGLLDGGS
ncbi:DESI1 [Auxenochlorella protothecoides x Auxenochlorella symbiontica]